MSCQGLTGDYLCRGWIERRNRIRKRDGQRCRGCNRTEEEVDLQVHHRVYGIPGECGNCVLTGVYDEDLLTLCVNCHDAITNARRDLRYSLDPVYVTLVQEPTPAQRVVIAETIITTEPTPEPDKRGVTIQRYQTGIARELTPDPPKRGVVIQRYNTDI